MVASIPDKAVDIHYLLYVLRERIKIMLLVFITTLVPMMIASFFIPPTYEVKAMLMIEQVPIKMPFYQDALFFRARPEGINLKKHSIMLRGSLIAAQVAHALSDSLKSILVVRNEPGALGKSIGWLKSRVFGTGSGALDSLASIEGAISNMLRSTNLFTVNTRAPNMIELASNASHPLVAFDVVSRYIEIYAADNLANNRKDVSRALDFVRQQWTKSEDEYFKAQQALLAAKRDHDIISSYVQVEDLELSAKLDHLDYLSTLAKDKYNMLSKKMMESEIQYAEISNNIRVVNPPELPSSPSGRARLKIRLLALLASFIFGIAAGFMVEYFRDLVNGKEDLDPRLFQHIVAIIPNLDASA